MSRECAVYIRPTEHRPSLDRVCLCDRIVFTGKEQSFQLTSDDVIIVETIAGVVLREDGVET